MGRITRFVVGIWILAASFLLTRLWLKNPAEFPGFPTAVAQRAVQWHGATNAEEVADLEILIGLFSSTLIVSMATSLGCVLWRRMKRRSR